MTDQIERNYRWFREALPELLSSQKGMHALLHNQAAIAYFQTSLGAVRAGLNQYGEGNFSVELVDDVVEDLGFFSHVSSALRA